MSATAGPKMLPFKRRNAPATKARIIAAAQRLFAAHGYAQTGLRDIAAEAGIALSLISQHFGAKADLFEAALLAAMQENKVLEVPKTQIGAAMIDYVLGEGDISLPSMVVLSTGDADARDITAHILREHIVTKLAETLGPPAARERALEITMIATGFLIYGRSLPVGPVSPRTRHKMARLIQELVDEG
jgi:AcrR family transcriptional regulator